VNDKIKEGVLVRKEIYSFLRKSFFFSERGWTQGGPRVAAERGED
jgi:hypothetical protein